MLKEILKMAKELPQLEVKTVSRHRGHYKVILSTPAGQQMLIVSVSASDHRAALNNRAILRRWARGVA